MNLNAFILFLTMQFFSFASFVCNAFNQPTNYPWFGNTESAKTQAERDEAEEGLRYFLDEAERGQEHILDAWSYVELRDGLKNALGFRKYCEILESMEASNSYARFALYSALGPKEAAKKKRMWYQLAKEKNPQFLTFISNNIPDLKLYWQTHDPEMSRSRKDKEFYKELYAEKIIDEAISQKWNEARHKKAQLLIDKYRKDFCETHLRHAISEIRYLASRGFSRSMYNLHVLFQEFGSATGLNEAEAKDYLEASARLENPHALNASAQLLIGKKQFEEAQARLQRFIELTPNDSNGYFWKDNAEYWLEMIQLYEKLIELVGDDVVLNVAPKFENKKAYTINRSMREGNLRMKQLLDELLAIKHDLDDSELEESVSLSTEKDIDSPLTHDGNVERKDITEKVDDKKITTDLLENVTQSPKRPTAQLKICRKSEKVKHRQSKRKKARVMPEKCPGQKLENIFVDNPIHDLLIKRLSPMSDLIDIILSKESYLNGRDLQRFFNALRGIDLKNSVGSHRTINLDIAGFEPTKTMTIVSAHKSSKHRDLTGKHRATTAKLRRLLHEMNINSVNDLR